MNMSKQKSKRIIFEVDERIYKFVKIMALERGMTLKKWLELVILKELQDKPQ